MHQQPLKTHKRTREVSRCALLSWQVQKHLACIFIYHAAHQTPWLPRMRPSCWIKCVTLKCTETHAGAFGMKPGLFTYCVTMLMRGWAASQRAGRHHCPTVWSGAAHAPSPSSSSPPQHLSPLLLMHSSFSPVYQTQPLYPTNSPFNLPVPSSPSFESHSEASLSSSCIVLWREAQ